MSRRLLLVAVFASLVAYLALMATIGGLVDFRGDWSGPLVVSLRGSERHFDHAWTYLVPAMGVTIVAAIIMFGSLVWIVIRPPVPRGRSTDT